MDNENENWKWKWERKFYVEILNTDLIHSLWCIYDLAVYAALALCDHCCWWLSWCLSSLANVFYLRNIVVILSNLTTTQPVGYICSIVTILIQFSYCVIAVVLHIRDYSWLFLSELRSYLSSGKFKEDTVLSTHTQVVRTSRVSISMSIRLT